MPASWALDEVPSQVQLDGLTQLAVAMGTLRVADASIMPDCIRANTNVTTMVIGERIADLMRQGF